MYYGVPTMSQNKKFLPYTRSKKFNSKESLLTSC